MMLAARQLVRAYRAALALMLGAGILAATPAHADSTGFYYGAELPVELLEVYERVVVDADVLRAAGTTPAQLGGRRARLLAYVSVGELGPGMKPQALAADWVLGRNTAWNSDVMDLTHPGWQRYLLEERMGALWAEGYRGFFLDTLDSYELAKLDAAGAAAQVAAMVSLVRAAHARYPGVELILNRGFAILDQVAPLIHGVAAESLFDRWDQAQGRYVPVPESDRAWLAGKLGQVRERYKLPIIVIDYRPPHERAQARATARRIAALGFEPWVTNATLTMVGVGAPEVVPRRILVLYDGAREASPGPGSDSTPALRFLAPVLEHEGYVPVFHDVHAPLPREPLPGRYAGIATWFPGLLDSALQDSYCRWLAARLDEGMRVAVLGELGFVPPASMLARLGLTRATRPTGQVATNATVTASPMLGLEAAPAAHRLLGPGLVAVSKDSGPTVHLRVSDASGPLRDPVVIGAWGGMALAPHILHQGFGGELAWVLDPFAFVRAALDLSPMPAPDPTTESGHRVLFVHVEGQGADRRAELRGMPEARTVVRRLLGQHRLPHTTSDPGLAQHLAHVTAEPLELIGPGGNPTRAAPSLTRLRPRVRPAGRPSGGQGPALGAAAELAVYMPVANEDGFRQDDGNAPFGFRRVIETFELTDMPRRLGPIAMHYHAYSGATPAGVRALEQVYAWIATAETFPTVASEYAAMARAAHGLVLARELDGQAWRIHGLGALRTVRLPPELGWPDTSQSPAVVAVRELPQGRYVSLIPGQPGARFARLVLRAQPPEQPVIVGANARIEELSKLPDGRVRVHARGRVPVSLVIGNLPAARCTLSGSGFRVRGQAHNAGTQAQRFAVPVADTGKAVLACAGRAWRK